MKETYTRQEAMDRLGLRSANAFLQLARKYPDAFVVVAQATTKRSGYDKQIRYDKAALDRFAEIREMVENMKDEEK